MRGFLFHRINTAKQPLGTNPAEWFFDPLSLEELHPHEATIVRTLKNAIARNCLADEPKSCLRLQKAPNRHHPVISYLLPTPLIPMDRL